MTRPAADFLRSIDLHAWADDPMTLAGTERILEALLEQVARWYAETGWQMDEDQVPDAIRAMLAARVGEG